MHERSGLLKYGWRNAETRQAHNKVASRNIPGTAAIGGRVDLVGRDRITEDREPPSADEAAEDVLNRVEGCPVVAGQIVVAVKLAGTQIADVGKLARPAQCTPGLVGGEVHDAVRTSIHMKINADGAIAALVGCIPERGHHG